MTGTWAPGGIGRPGRLELLALVALLAIAALVRLPGLEDRGRWDADQGTDMLVLRALAVDGEVPLLGPRTSIGTFHHGAVYYYLLAPAAIVSGADPVAVTFEIALFGLLAVAGTWWLARLAGGPIAAGAAGLLAALSPAGIDESTFIWNPNLIPAAAALAFAATIQARRSGRARWWVLAGVGAMVTGQCHVLGVVIVLPLLWAWGASLVERHRAGLAIDGVLRGGIGAALVLAAGYLPLLVHELGHDFSEVRSILSYVAGGGREAAGGGLDRMLMVGLRSITWPVSGLITDRVAVSMLATLLVIALAGIAAMGVRARRAPSAPGAGADAREVGEPAAMPDAMPDAMPEVMPGPGPARWLIGAIVVSVVLLAVFAPSLAIVIPELPNDHYHAFLDPAVLALVGVGLARLATSLPGGIPGRLLAAGGLVVLVAIGIPAWPPATAPDGGYPLADAAAERVLAATGDQPLLLDGLPSLKNDNAMRFPLERHGAQLLDAGMPPASAPGSAVVIVCDPLFDEVTGLACGGAAEDAWLEASARAGLELVERFESGSRRVLSVYTPALSGVVAAP